MKKFVQIALPVILVIVVVISIYLAKQNSIEMEKKAKAIELQKIEDEANEPQRIEDEANQLFASIEKDTSEWHSSTSISRIERNLDRLIRDNYYSRLTTIIIHVYNLSMQYDSITSHIG